jgi:hypothetical protein
MRAIRVRGEESVEINRGGRDKIFAGISASEGRSLPFRSN